MKKIEAPAQLALYIAIIVEMEHMLNRINDFTPPAAEALTAVLETGGVPEHADRDQWTPAMLETIDMVEGMSTVKQKIESLRERLQREVNEWVEADKRRN